MPFLKKKLTAFYFEGFKCRILVLKSVNDFLTVNNLFNKINAIIMIFSALRAINALF